MKQPTTYIRTHTNNGKLGILVSKQDAPEFLVKAKTAVEAGRIDEATELLNDQAIEVVCQMVEKNPSRIDLMFLLALTLSEINQLLKAEELYKKVLEIEPNPLVLYELGRICVQTQRQTEATQYRRKAVKADPENTVFWVGLAIDLIREGQLQEGIELLQKTIEKVPCNADVHSKLLFHLHYLPEMNPGTLFEEHKRWGWIQAPISMAKASHDNDPDPNRRLRIGYISPDFRKHSIAYNFEAFLDGHDRQVVEVYGYGNVAKPDEVTQRFENKFDHYRNIYGVSDKDVAVMIEQDKIDVLVEMAGHVGNNCMVVFAYKPAPIQVDYGGINTSGMQQIDYRLTDDTIDSPQSEKFYTEELVYLPDGFFCYTPPDFAPPVMSLPALANGCVTFGSFNNSMKINPYIISLWSKILKANEGSRFLMKFRGGNDQEMRQRYYRYFEQLGINQDRIAICGWKSSTEHLQLYGQIDITLDTYPFNGCLTTLEGLWMGVPTITLSGKGLLLSRVGQTILSRIGLEYFAASTPDEYVAKATALAKNPDALAKIRASMRQRMAGSVLCDAKGFAANIEAAYRKMWHRWCRSKGVDVPDTDFVTSRQYCGDVCSSQSNRTTADVLEEV